MFLGFKVSICLMTLSFYNLTVKQCRHTNKTWKIQTSLQMRGQKKWPEQKKIKFSSENIKYDTRNYAISINDQKQPSRGVLKKRCCENMQQIYRRTPLPKCNFIEISLRHWCSSVNLLHVFRTHFPRNTSGCLLLKSIRFTDLQEI